MNTSGLLPSWCRLVRADNPSPMTLEGTNTYLLRVRDGTVVVDPGPLLDEHLERVAAEAGSVVLTLLTHGHPDHAEGSGRFREITGAPVAARDPALCIDTAPLDRDGARVGVEDLDLRVLHTPGHTADSVSFLVAEPGEPGVLTGDTVLGRGTTVVAHPDGALAPYLDSLGRLRDLGPTRLLPGHGPVRDDAAAVAQDYLNHRVQRLEEVRAALAGGARTAREVVEVVYAKVDQALWDAAELSVRAQLEYLGRDEP
ncbi:MAG TPA: MBL fold metallo-hydrolase [Jiangellales bacterium]|nr:MBL fold metallo-hydrolase [Jiangellales bacterium]